MSENWSSAAFATGERFDAWSEALNASFLPWQLAKPARPEVEAELRQRHYNGFRFLSCKCGEASPRALPAASRRRSRTRAARGRRTPA